MLRSLVILAALLSVVYSYGYYRDAMPNGRRVPCDGGLCTGYCEGFGHVKNDESDTCNGGGEHPYHYLSTFGKSWETFKMVWSKEMCMADPDTDGASNGDEMGDPCCMWTAGTNPSRTTSITNPARTASVPSFPSCTYAGAPIINISVGSVTQSTITLEYITSSCMCGFEFSQTSPKQVSKMQIAILQNPVLGSSKVSITALEPDTDYTFGVSAYNLAGGSPIPISVKTPPTSPSSPSPPLLNTPTSTTTSLSFSWSAPSTDVSGGSLSSSVTGYELDLGTNGIYTTVYSSSALQTTVTGLQPATSYLARVRAVNLQGVGLSSSSVNVTTPAYNGTAVSATYSTDGFKLGWNIEGDVITFQMTGSSLGYVAVGWGDSPTMTNTDMVVGSFDSATGTGRVFDLWSTSRNTPTFDTTQDAIYISGTQTTTTTTISFSRKLNTNDKNKQDIIINNKNMYLVWAIGSGVVSNAGSFSVHTKRGAAEINFLTGKTGSLNTDKLKNAHAGLSFFAWGILLPLGSFIARYKRCDMGVWWFRAHVTMQITGSVLTFIAFILIASALGTTSAHFSSPHAICGLIMLIATLAQNAVGAYSHFVYNPNRKKVPVFPDRVHGVFGLATLMFGFLTIFLGFDFYHVNLGAWLLGAQCLLFAVTGALVYEFFDGSDKDD